MALSLALSARASAQAVGEPGARLVLPKAERVTHVAAIFDAALVPLGKIGGRFEVAFTPMHALYIEPSYIVRRIPGIERSISATEVDIGWHVFPQARGLCGFYLGPRALFAATSVEEATATAWGIGADFGYQWVLDGGPAFNLGIGIAYYHATAHPRPEAVPIFSLLQPAYQQAISQAAIHAWGVMPLGMAGMGFAY